MYRAAFYQFRPLFGQPQANLSKVLTALAGVQADLVVLPELPFTGYHFRNRTEACKLAEDPRASPLVEALVELCRRQGFHLVTGFAERDGERCFNSSLLLGPRGIVETYRKIQLFMNEKSCFDPGNLPLRVRRVRGARIGMMICFDWVFPEIARTLALQGADVLCHPSNLVLKKHCQQAMLTRCVENSVYAVTANRCGEDRRPHGTLRFTGRSQVVGPRGQLLFQAPATRQTVHVEPLDLAQARDKKLTRRNHLLRDRRPEFYFK